MKYLFEITKGYTSKITMRPVFGVGETSEIPFTIHPGRCIARTQREALASVRAANENGGQAHFIGKS